VQRLLIVDDDIDIRTLLAEQLQNAGFEVSSAGDGQEMFQRLEDEHVDLIILDLNLPHENGLGLCGKIRARSNTPIIMLTARSEPIDRIIGLEIGADDYVTKPFEPRELLARIRSVLRRTDALPTHLETVTTTGRARIAGWTLDFQKRHLVDANGRVVVLSGSEFRLLRIFVLRANRILTREQLALASGRSYESRAIDLQISRLRHKLGDDKASSPIIKTVRNEGYVLAAEVVLE
jgi:two-component system, OmpR family, response regulator